MKKRSILIWTRLIIAVLIIGCNNDKKESNSNSATPLQKVTTDNNPNGFYSKNDKYVNAEITISGDRYQGFFEYKGTTISENISGKVSGRKLLSTRKAYWKKEIVHDTEDVIVGEIYENNAQIEIYPLITLNKYK